LQRRDDAAPIRDGDAIGDACDPSTSFDQIEAAVQILMGRRANDDSFAVEALLTLNPGSNGIDPLGDSLVLNLASVQMTIPAGALRRGILGGYVFAGSSGTVRWVTSPST